MSIAVSPMATDATSPMITSVTPTVEPRGEETEKKCDPGQRYEKLPPLHTVADWKVVLHLPEIETWLRLTTERVRDLTYSVQQDAEHKHVDVHLVQLKDIYEDISDHVEQIHALLETEFSLKLLSYSVNIIVDIHTVQLLWHQLRVSVLVLKERVLQGLQDSNGNYTRQTDILQAFSEDKNEARLDSLTEVDDSGQLTIKCSQDYFSLDCGITAYELSDYSPSEDLPTEVDAMTSSQVNPKSHKVCCYPDFPDITESMGLLTVTAECTSPVQENVTQQDVSLPISSKTQVATNENQSISVSPPDVGQNAGLVDSASITHSGSPPHSDQSMKSRHQSCCESLLSKRTSRDCFNDNEVSPTRPSQPKKAMYFKGMSRDDIESILNKIQPSSLLCRAEVSRSSPSLLDPPDRSNFWLELKSVYPSNPPSAISQSYECLNKIEEQKDMQPLGTQRNSLERNRKSELTEEKKVLDLPQHDNSPRISNHGQEMLSGREEKARATLPKTSAQSKDNDIPSGKESAAPFCRTESQHLPVSTVPAKDKDSASPKNIESRGNRDTWYGSDEYLSLPSQLKKTELLALKLENLAKVVPQNPREEIFQDIDDWELSEVNSDCETYPLFQPSRRHGRELTTGMISPTSSSDIAPSLDESLESGTLSDLLSEEELLHLPEKCTKQREEWSVPTSRNADDPNLSKSALIQQLLEDIRHQDNYEAIWEKMEAFVNKLDEFICWLHEALETTENWTPPRAETDSLKLYLETHLSFKLNVDSHAALKDAVLEEGRQLLEFIVSHKSGLKDMLQMILSQWKELQKQIKRQHSWILRALEIIKAEILASDVSQEEEDGAGSPKGEEQKCHLDAQRDVVEQMSLKLYSHQYSSSIQRKKEFAEMSKASTTGSKSMLDFELDYQELWDWLTDMESIMMDSHDLMMSEEQQQHLYKGSFAEMVIWRPKKMQLLSRVEAVQRSGAALPDDVETKVAVLTTKWDLLEKTLAERTQSPTGGPAAVAQRDLLSPETGSLVTQLQGRIKELKGWLRDTELFIFNSCHRHEKDTSQQGHKQLQYLKSLCSEIKQRRRGVTSVLRLCQRLLEDQDTCVLDSERQSLQLIVVNLERRWEAIVMQAIQWQNRLQKSLGEDQVPVNIVEPALLDLNSTTEDSWEWDETDISNNLISIDMESCDFEGAPSRTPDSVAHDVCMDRYEHTPGASLCLPPTHPQIYQVYSLHGVELYGGPRTFGPKTPAGDSNVKQPNLLKKSLSKDSSFSSTESLPDLLGGIITIKEGKYVYCGDETRRSESESGIVSEGDTETTANSEICSLKLAEEQQGSGSTGSRGEDPNQTDVGRSNDSSYCETRESTGLVYSLAQPCKNDEDMHQEEPISGESQSETEQITCRGDARPVEGDIGFQGVQSTKAQDGTSSDSKSSRALAVFSRGSSLDSLSIAGDLFTSSREALHRSTSLESWLAPGRSTEEISRHQSRAELGLSSDSLGELSKRTLDLLKRLENVQNPLSQKMKRSISDITLQSSSLKAAPAGQLALDVTSSINEDSAASLTELSSSEDFSLCSEDIAVQRNRIVDSNASFRKQVHHIAIPDEADVSISMIVNVSCTSACTDDDEDDSDLLSSSTLTLTEEELGVQNDEDDDDDDNSSIATDDEYIESSFVSGLEYMKSELQNWIKPKTSPAREKLESALGDELQCSALCGEKVKPVITAHERRFLSRSALKLLESSVKAKSEGIRQKEYGFGRKVLPEQTRPYRSQYVDDMENGNVDGRHLKGKDEEDELLKEEDEDEEEEETIFGNGGEALCSLADSAKGLAMGAGSSKRSLPSSLYKESYLENQLRGEIPCCSSISHLRSFLPLRNSKGYTKEMTDNDSSPDLCPANCEEGHKGSSCCTHQSRPNEEDNGEDDGSVHNFVMEIIDMASEALNPKTHSDSEAGSPNPVAQIRDKVLEHSHRPIRLKKGDFYSYLSLSSHDSDCGEVNTYDEEKSSTPLPTALADGDQELLFEACEKDDYDGPKLDCHRPATGTSGEKPNAAAPLLKGSAARSQLEDHNEASYLNPFPCETLIDTAECFADTKTLESNISPVMTKIRDSCSSTNPLKEEDGLYINPKINCPQMRKGDRDEKSPASPRMKQKHGRSGCRALQEAKSPRVQALTSDKHPKGDRRAAAKGTNTCDYRAAPSTSQIPRVARLASGLPKRPVCNLAPSRPKAGP
ncbi:A-kinase anchor protein 6 [Polypterus senegalus]|nr:A-kinase anchor protein 6 [Polypterus senegalus]XP_039597396.1 A-kinase anchor protein 6 [Polypterus senegalus]